MKPFVWVMGGRWYVGARRYTADPFRYWHTVPGLERASFPTAAAAGDAVRAHIASS